MGEAGAHDEAADIADGLRWEHASTAKNPHKNYIDGISATRALNVLKCSKCVLEKCLVRDMLQNASHKQPYPTAPTPLNRERPTHHEASLLSMLTSQEIDQFPQNDTPLKDVIDSLEGVHLRSNIPTTTGLPTTFIRNAHNDMPPVELIDATNVVDSGNIPPANTESSRVLLNKIALLATKPNGDNQPQIHHPSSIMTKVIRVQAGNARIDEVRMAGKSRLFFMIRLPEEERRYDRIILLGSHGDSAQYQHAFFRRVFPDTRRSTS